MRTVLVRPSHRTGSLFLKKLGFLPVPIGLLQLAGELLEDDGNEVSVIDMEADDKSVQEVARDIAVRKPGLVGITLHATAAHNTAVAIVRETKKLVGGVKFVAGGHHATFMAEELIRAGFDMIVLGEGDEAIAEIARALDAGEGLSRVKGIVYGENGSIYRTAKRSLMKDLDRLAMPALGLVDPSKYRLETFGADESVVCLETSRGCPYACEFCSVTPVWGNRWRCKSNERILKELEHARTLGYSWVFFTDDVFFAEPVVGRRRELFDAMVDRELGLRWIAQTRPDAVVRHPDLVAHAARAGMRMAAIGVESGSRETLRRMRKGLRPSTSQKAVEILDGQGIMTLCSIMLGAPFESVGDMVKTIRFGSRLVDSGADLIQFTIYTPFPGTPLFYDSVRNGRLITTDWERFDILTPVMKTRVNPSVIQVLQHFGVYYFQIRSFLRFKLKKDDMKGEKGMLLEKATGYVIGKLSAYLGDALSLPLRMRETARLFKYALAGEMDGEIPGDAASPENTLIYGTAD